MPRNPKNINDRVDDRLMVCELMGGRFDGTQLVLNKEDREPEIRMETRVGKEVRLAVYVRVCPRRFMFERYES